MPQVVKKLVTRTYRFVVKTDKENAASAYLRVQPGKPGIVCRVFTKKKFRQQGFANLLMQQIINDYGSKMELKLWPHPRDETGLNKNQLREWYKKFGFQDTHAKLMLRPRD
jgi:predicted GNAT family N-acyltransferase